MKLTKEEKEILEAFEKGKTKSVSGSGNIKSVYKNYAKETIRKSSVLHKYVTGKLKE
jgi:hypothetical protein